MKTRFYLLLCGTVLLAACETDPVGLPTPEAPVQKVDLTQLALGEKLFQANCASCHGAKAEGDANWRQRDAMGNFPPPPLNGTGHAWHHSVELLKSVIRDGSPDGKGNMPAWAGKLNNNEMEAVIAWFQSLWDKQIYDIWFEMQQQE